MKRDFVYAELKARDRAEVSMVRTDEHKLVKDHLAGQGELYDYSDPHLERINHFADPAYRGIRSSLEAKLNQRRSEIHTTAISP